MPDNLQSAHSDPRFTGCRPITSSRFEVESRIEAAGVVVQIQRYQWDQTLRDGVFSPSVCYLDLALEHRPTIGQSVLRHEGHRASLSSRSTGECVFLPASSELRVYDVGGSSRVVSCLFDAARFESYLDVEWSPMAISACLDLRNPNIHYGLRRLAEEALFPGFASELLVESVAGSLVVELARHFRGMSKSMSCSGSNLTARQVRLIHERVEHGLDRVPSLDELSKLLDITSRHLTRAYKLTTGTTLGEFITSARIRHAKALLSKRQVLIKTVAFSTGFHNPAAFTAAFRKATGWTPQQFRKEVLGLID